MLKIALIDDEPDQIEIIADLLKDFFALDNEHKYEIHAYAEGRELLEQLGIGFDLIFLDYQMPGMSGYETARKIREVDGNVKIFFVTGFEQHWKAGYKVSAYRYIVKPIDREDFFADMRAVVENLTESEEIITFRPGGEIVNIPASRFLYACSDRRGIAVHFLNSANRTESIRVRGGIKVLGDALREYGFVQPHVSYCVNPRHIKAMRREPEMNDAYIELSNGEKLFVARNRKREIMDAMNNFVGDGV